MTIFRGEELIFRRERCCETVATELDAAALGPGQLLVEARYTLVSQGTELANFTGLDPGTRQPGSWNCYPHRPGYASAGTVVATGPAVGREPRFEPGDQVLAITPHARYGVADTAIRLVTGLRADDDQRTLILARMAAVAMTAVRKASSVDLGSRAVVVGPGWSASSPRSCCGWAAWRCSASRPPPSGGRRPSPQGCAPTRPIPSSRSGSIGPNERAIPTW